MADLTTTAKAKAYMQKTDAGDDALIAVLVTAASDRIEKICQRVFSAADYIERHDGNRQRLLVLVNRPVNSVFDVACGAANAISVSATSFLKATIQVTTTGVVLRSMATDGTVTNTSTGADLLFSESETNTLMAVAINAVAGWTAAVVENGPSDMLNPLGGVDVSETTENLTWADQALGFTIDRSSGRLSLSQQSNWPVADQSSRRLPFGFQSIFVRYNGGFSTIPADLEQIANEFVAMLFNAGPLNPNLTSESLGDYSYSLAAATDLTQSQMDILRRYMEIATGGSW